MSKPIKEAIGGLLSPSSNTPINKISDNPVVKAIIDIIKKDKALKDVELVGIYEDGDVYHMDLRFQIENPSVHAQYSREEGKHRAYDIKRQLEIALMGKFNIPSFSIAGVRTVQGETTICEFEISFIYANKGNIKPNNESLERDQRVRTLVESALKAKVTEEKDPLKEIYDEAKDLEESILEDMCEEQEELEEDGQMPIKEAAAAREAALNFLERIGDLKRKEEE